MVDMDDEPDIIIRETEILDITPMEEEPLSADDDSLPMDDIKGFEEAPDLSDDFDEDDDF